MKRVQETVGPKISLKGGLPKPVAQSCWKRC